MAEKRKRGQNFTNDEKDKILKLLVKHKRAILNEKTDGATNEAKSNAWIALTASFNTSGTKYRSKESIIKMWGKLKSESKTYASQKKTTINPVLEQVCAILGRDCTENKLIEDIDYTGNRRTQESDYILEEAPQSPHIPFISMDNESLLNHETADVCEDTIRTTPLRSGKQPMLTCSIEQTDTMSSICDSFKVNNHKADIEELKLQMLQEEINFKRKLYNLQLQSVAKELEIKNEMLLQVKGTLDYIEYQLMLAVLPTQYLD